MKRLKSGIGAKMTDKKHEENDENEGRAQAPTSAPPKTVREVVVKHLDAPPPSGKQAIHPRRPAPIVPTHEKRTENQPAEDANSKKTNSQ
jgi:hypothetical protein